MGPEFQGHPYPVLSAGFRNPHLNGSKEPGTASSCCCCKMGSTPGLGTKLGQSRRLLVSSIMIADPQNHTSLLHKSSLLLSNRPCHKHTSALETGFQVCSSALFFSVLNTTFALLFPTLELTLDNLFTQNTLPHKIHFLCLFSFYLKAKSSTEWLDSHLQRLKLDNTEARSWKNTPISHMDTGIQDSTWSSKAWALTGSWMGSGGAESQPGTLRQTWASQAGP